MVKIFYFILLFFYFVQLLPIKVPDGGEFPEQKDKMFESGMRPKKIVKRSVSNGIQLLKIFTEINRRYHCQISLTIRNSSYLNQSMSIQDDVSKFVLTNIKTNLISPYNNESILVMRFLFNGTPPNITVDYDFEPNNLTDRESRNVSLFSGQNTTTLVESDCLQRANFKDSVATNSALIIWVFIAIIIMLVIFLILWWLHFRRVQKNTEEVQHTKSGVNPYIKDSNLLTADSNKTYYEQDPNPRSKFVVMTENQLFESDLQDARFFDDKLQEYFWKLNDVVFTIWLNSIVAQYPNVRDKANQTSKQRITDRDNIRKTHQNKLTEKFKMIKKEMIRKNNVNLEHQKITQDEERERILAQVMDKDKDEVSSNLDKLFERENENLVQQLKVEQEEAFENAKLKCQAEMMSAITENQMVNVKNLIVAAGLTPEENDEIMQRFLQWQQKLQGATETEKIRQAAELEYLLENRANQKKRKEEKEEHNKELLKKKTSHFVDAITDFEDNDDISRELSSKILNQFEHDKEKLMNEMEKSKNDQVAALLERINEAKRKKLDDFKVKQENEINNLFTVHATDTDADDLIDNIVQLKNQHRQELTSFEAETDVKNTEDLVNLLHDIGVQTLEKIDERIIDLTSELKYSGLTENDIEDIISDSNEKMKKLQKIQQKEREDQNKRLNDRLQKIKKDIDDNATRQAKDQTNIIAAQFDVISEITNMQKTLSDEERNSILGLFAKNRSTMETNIANGYIMQRRKMDDIINAKKESQRKKLEELHRKEIKEIYENGSKNKNQKHMDEAVSHCVSDFVFAKLQAFDHKDSQKELDKELEKIRKEILEERVLLIHRKEEEIAALLNKFQIEKATQHIEIKDQQEKIKKLQMVILDTMDKDKSVKSVIARHNENKEVLMDSIDMNKRRQEIELQRRLEKKRKTFLLTDKTDRGNVEEKENVTQMKKQNLEDSILKNNLNSEIEVKKVEIELLKTLMESGDYPRSEMLTVLRQTFPLKTNQEIDVMAEEIYPKSKEKPNPQKTLLPSYEKITEKTLPFNSSTSLQSGNIFSESLNQAPRSRPSTAKKMESRPPKISTISDDIAMNGGVLDDTSNNDLPTIKKPKKKRRKQRELPENIEEEDVEKEEDEAL